MAIQIRLASNTDVDALSVVLRQAFAEFEPLYTEGGFAATVLGADAIVLRMKEGPVWVAVYDEHLVGTAAAVRRAADVYVRGMAIVPGARGYGIGRLLLQEVESFARSCNAERLFLSTTPFLTAAIRLYQQFGFMRTGEGPHDLFGTQLFTMEKSLQNRSRAC